VRGCEKAEQGKGTLYTPQQRSPAAMDSEIGAKRYWMAKCEHACSVVSLCIYYVNQVKIMEIKTEVVTLDMRECYQAGLVGMRRNMEAILYGRKPRFPEKLPGELYGFHILAAQSEMAVAKLLNKYWSFHENKFSGGDVGSYEVRYSQRHDLKVRPRDKGVVVSVTGCKPDKNNHALIFTVAGWVDAEEAKQERWKKDFGKGEHTAAYFVPHGNLNEIGRLI